MNKETEKEKTTLWDLLKQEITCKIYQLILIFSLGIIIGSLFK